MTAKVPPSFRKRGVTSLKISIMLCMIDNPSKCFKGVDEGDFPVCPVNTNF